NVGLPTALLKRGIVLRRTGRCKEAIRHIERTLAMWESTGNADLYPVSYALAPLGACQCELGRHREAEAPVLRALAMREKPLGPKHPEVLQLVVALARVHHRMGDDRRAAEEAARALDGFVETHQPGNLVGEARLALAAALWSSDRARARDKAQDA